MSYDIVRSIVIKNDKVYFTSAPNNVSPRSFTRQEVPGYSDLYQKEGMLALLKDIAANLWAGNYRLSPHSLIARYMDESYVALKMNLDLRHFLDKDTAAQFIAESTINWMKDPDYNPRKEIKKLDDLRYDKDAVISICENHPHAFWYASREVKEDREAAKEYIEKCADKFGFGFPLHFGKDKELARMALEKNGSTYRSLDPVLQENKEFARLAYIVDLPWRERFPDFLPKNILEDKPFMCEILQNCPELHIHRKWDILDDPECAAVWTRTSEFVPFLTSEMPEKYLKDPYMQTLLSERFEKDGYPEKLQRIFSERGISMDARKKTGLDAQIRKAQSKVNCDIDNTPMHSKSSELQR